MARKKIEPRTYNLKMLAEEVAGRVGGKSIEDEHTHLKGVLSVIIELVAAGHTVKVTGFATIEPVDRPGRVARNPQTGGKVWVEAHKGVKFTPHAAFRNYVNGDLKVTRKQPVRLKAPKGSLQKGAV